MPSPSPSQPTTKLGCEHAAAEVKRLSAPGVLGIYTHFEATEIFAYRDGDPAPLNIFSIFVAEERVGVVDREPIFLGKRITLKSLKGWTFGIQRYVRPISELNEALDHFCRIGVWQPSGEQLQVGPLTPISPQFVPPDSTTAAPWNSALKNNFWNGSYVIEMRDTEKTALKPFFDEPPRLQELSDTIQKQVPIRIASLSDRLGNIAVQLPVTVIVSKFAKDRVGGDFTATVAWHQLATPRPLRASFAMDFDNIISGYVSGTVQGSQTTLAMAGDDGMLRGVLWDDLHQVVLAAMGSTGFISTIAFNMLVMDPDPRVFTIKDDDGRNQQIRVGLTHGSKHSVTAPGPNQGEDWTRRRIYRDEATRLAAQRRFVQYKPTPGQQNAEHTRALNDIRILLSQYGESGAWLWDPYLSAHDILNTLFHCPHVGANLRALTAGHEAPSGIRAKPTLASIGGQISEWIRLHLFRPPPAKPTFADRQRATFSGAASNLRGLRLEYRMKTGPAGWGFHDRFLIFPETSNGALAWSLGTSVNSAGKQHHILQQVDDGQLVVDAFRELWDQLGQTEHLVWKTP
jgi:hypothetical protein